MITFDAIHLDLGGQPVLRGFDLTPERGKLSLLVGPNGAGKSSALKIAAGLWKPSSGCIRYMGKVLKPGVRRGDRIAYLPQAPSFHPRLRTETLIRFYARLEGGGRPEARSALERFGLEAHARHRSGELSGGLRQRLGLAVLSLSRAPVWLLDEPGLSLDPFWRHRLQSWLREICAEEGHTVLVATHLLAEWDGRADCCHLCEGGRIVGQFDPANLRNAALRVESNDVPLADFVAKHAVESVHPPKGKEDSACGE